jgi:menaquinone-dependent protoporphyrinogen oxidase
MNVLVGYASLHGSTREIAERIAQTIRARSQASVDVRSVDEIRDVRVVDAVVFGSGVYDGSWTREATEFIRRHASSLSAKPVWLFTVGTFGDNHPVIGALMRKEPREIGEFEAVIRPRGYRVFAGVIDLDRWPAWGRIIFRALGGHAGDNRDWKQIDEWGKEIAAGLSSEY